MGRKVLSALEYLGIDGVTVMVARNDALLARMSPKGYELEAMTVQTSLPDAYNIFMKGKYPSILALAHEMVHLHQMHRKDLSTDLKSGKAVWKGEEYDNSTPYEEREWEQEAFKEQKRIYKLIKI